MDDVEENITKTDTILFVGNIKKHKGLHTLISAYKKLLSLNFQGKLVIIGNADNFRTTDNLLSEEINSLPIEANNISSAMCVRYLLNNAYVCEGDILLHKPKIIQKYQYKSNYCGIKCDRTDDWCLFENKGRITGYAVGGENCHQMMGISYWTEEDGKKLGDCIKKVYEMPGGKERYWDQVAFAYFDKFAENIVQFTSSGSGPMNALVQKEAAVALGMTGQAVTMLNEGAPFKIIFFEEGAPCSLYGHAITKKAESRADYDKVKEVFDYLVKVVTPACDAKFFPEQVFVDKVFTLPNYPTDIPYGDMSNNTTEEKARLLGKWMY